MHKSHNVFNHLRDHLQSLDLCSTMFPHAAGRLTCAKRSVYCELVPFGSTLYQLDERLGMLLLLKTNITSKITYTQTRETTTENSRLEIDISMMKKKTHAKQLCRTCWN